MALAHSTDHPLGSQAIDFNLKGIDDHYHKLESFQEKQCLLIIFMCNHCPYVKAILPRLIELQKDFEDRGFQLVGINSNDSVRYPDDSFEAMQNTAREKGINFIYLHDETQEVAKAYRAVCTPDIYLFDADQKLVYHGRLDDNWEHPELVKEHSLRLAIEEVLSGNEISRKQVPSMGCSIKWK